MNKKEVNCYFTIFEESFEYAVRSAEYLEEVIKNFNGGVSEEQMAKMHVIEHEADIFLRETLAKLAKEFITPIENEDILIIIKKIEEATDTIEDVLINMHTYGVTQLPLCADNFVDIIKRECAALAIVLKEFPNFKKSNVLKNKIMEVISIEEEGDRMYLFSLKELYRTKKDFKEIYITDRIINAFEDCCDIIEVVAQVIDEAVMKNS